LLQDLAYVLEQLVTLARERQVDLVVIGAGIPVILVAGNHDSAQRLGFGSRLLSARGFHVFAPWSSAHDSMVLSDF